MSMIFEDVSSEGVVNHIVIKDIHFTKKHNVDHVFAITDNATVNNFLNYSFLHWENSTFDTFEQVKDKDSVAIDIGSWIGTTAIWLAKNFSHVICIEADNESIKHLKINLKLSNCKNTTICENPISNTCSDLIFGPRNTGSWNVLNNSTSYLKSVSDSVHDYTKKCVTLKQVIYNYASDLNKISFIKCDIEGGECTILEDIFCYCLSSGASCYISFHLVWWLPGYNLDNFATYFKYFDCYDITKKIDDPSEYIKKEPFGSLLFRPRQSQSTEKIKKIHPSVLISSYKDLEQLEKFISEIKKFTNDIVIVSNENITTLPYFIIQNCDKDQIKKDKFVKYLLENDCIVFDADKISQLLEMPEELNKLMS